MLKFKNNEDRMLFLNEILETTLEDISECDLKDGIEFVEKELNEDSELRQKMKARMDAKLDSLRPKTKDLKKSRDMKKGFTARKISRSLKNFYRTGFGKSAKQKVGQLRKAGKYDMFARNEIYKVMAGLERHVMMERDYTSTLNEELDIIDFSESFCGKSREFLSNLYDFSESELTVLFNVSPLAGMVTELLNLEENGGGAVVTTIIKHQEQGDEKPTYDELAEQPQHLEDTHEKFTCSNGVCKTPAGYIVESVDHGQAEITFSSDVAIENNPSIIARASGPCFFGEGISRNGRIYPTALWDNLLEDKDFQKKLAERTLFSTLGHEQKVDEEAIAKGLISHVITKMHWEDDSKRVGIAEWIILDTESGRNLKTMMEAGVRMKMSTRGFGAFMEKSEAKKMYPTLPENQQVVDPVGYTCSGIDAVIDPGFLSAEAKKTEFLKG